MVAFCQEKEVPDLQDWRKEQDEKMKSPTGWLALTGHYWLKEGENSFGSEEDSDIKLPTNLKEKCSGVIRVSGGDVTLEVTDLGGLQVNGKSTRSATLQIEAAKEEVDGSDKVTIGDRVTIQLVRRTNRLAIRVRDRESSLLREFAGKVWFDFDPQFQVKGKFVPVSTESFLDITNIKGGASKSELAGTIEFEFAGKSQTLLAIREGEGELFVVFRDKTSGSETYSAGRFLYVKTSEDGNVLLDFNRAYNPPCAFSPHTLCPLPPKENELGFAVRAGEKKPIEK